MFHGFEAESNADEYHHPHYLCRRLHGSCHPATAADPTAQGVIAIVRAKAQKKNPYKQEVFTDQKDFQEAMARA